jgi:hypothetical protein
MVGPGSEFGFENPLHFFNLLTPILQVGPEQVRPEFGLGLHADHHQKNALLFFSFLQKFGTLTAPHNRQVEDGRPLPFKSFWAHHFSYKSYPYS